jgi:hypothetical protein
MFKFGSDAILVQLRAGLRAVSKFKKHSWTQRAPLHPPEQDHFALTSTGWYHRAGRTGQQRHAQIRFERVDLSYDRGVRHGSPARGGREAAKAADFNEDRKILREPHVFHLCILCTVVSAGQPLNRLRPVA